jgi:hypothetical protein
MGLCRSSKSLALDRTQTSPYNAFMTTSAPSSLSILDLFSGIGGFSYAAEQLVGGFHTVAFCDTDKACHKVLAKHWPATPIFPDIRELTAADIKPLCPNGLSLITAGFPCQDLSVAGKQAGYDGERSVLFYEIIRLARELRPDFLLLENVRNLLSHQNGETFQETLFQIAKAGYDAEWAVIPASDVGACHRRSESGLLPTPRRGETSDLKSTPGDHFSLSAWARQGQWMLPTPNAGLHNYDEAPESWLARRDRLKAKGINGNGAGLPLGVAVKLRTPTTGMVNQAPAEPQAPTSSLKCWSAEDRMLPTPLARDWKGVGRAGQLPTVLAPTGAATYLNPSFVEEMMGYPIGWTDLSN